MAKRWNVSCDLCNAKGSFIDTHEIIQSRWKITAWVVQTNEPRVICDKCQVNKPKKK